MRKGKEYIPTGTVVNNTSTEGVNNGKYMVNLSTIWSSRKARSLYIFMDLVAAAVLFLQRYREPPRGHCLIATSPLRYPPISEVLLLSVLYRNKYRGRSCIVYCNGGVAINSPSFNLCAYNNGSRRLQPITHTRASKSSIHRQVYHAPTIGDLVSYPPQQIPTKEQGRLVSKPIN